jgi:hypothetical protein
MRRLTALLFVAVGCAAFTQCTAAPPNARPGQQVVDVEAALKTVAPDLDARLARFKPVRMPYDASALSPRERQMVDQLVIALHQLENIFWRQSIPRAWRCTRRWKRRTRRSRAARVITCSSTAADGIS